MPAVEMRPAFEVAVITRINWLAEHAPEEWLDNFLSALQTLHHDSERFPEASPVLKQDARVVVHQRRFPDGLPYVVLYAHLREDPITVIYLTHLFHERQRRSRLDLRRWPW